MKKILIADDEEKILKIVSQFLRSADYEVIEAKDGKEAYDAFLSEKPDLVILDIMMPEINGWELCREIRKTSNVPVVFLTARSEEFDALMGYESGADDFITKPFSPSVLVKKVDVLLKRAGQSAGETEISKPELVFDLEAHEVYLNGNEIKFTFKEYNILSMLYRNAGKVYSREQLLDEIWGYDFDGDERTVDSHVARIRMKLGDWGDKHLKTIYGVGYKIEVKK